MTTAARPSPPAPPASPPAPPARPLRRDAQRNRDAIVAAARQVFCDHGLEAPLEEIARRAGVGIATLYRRFPSRVELLDAVLAQTVQAHVEVAEQALATDDPWDGFAYYLEETSRLQAADRGLNDVMGMRFPRATDVEAAKARLFDLVAQVVARAQQSGQLRADLTLEDLAFLNWANARILPAGRAAGAPDVWRRHLGFLLDGFRADRAHPLPQPPLSPRQVHRAMVILGRRSAGDAHEHPASASSASAPAATAQRSPLASHDPPGRSRQ
jgi:AcrR family transcriptional regulator